MSETDALVHNAAQHAVAAGDGAPMRPARRVAVVTCMDARVNPYRILGLRDGDAHILRNAGGIVSDDVLRSLAVSQRMLGTEEVVVIHHTGCGVLGYSDIEWRASLAAETGSEPPWSCEVTADVDANVRAGLQRIRTSPFLAAATSVRGFVYDVEDRTLREVVPVQS